jgi:hypothetical protein
MKLRDSKLGTSIFPITRDSSKYYDKEPEQQDHGQQDRTNKPDGQ